MKFTDEQLIEKTLSGDKNAYEKLVQKYQDMVYGLAFHFTKNFADAQDIAQEAFINGYLNLASLKKKNKFAGWMRTITANLCKSLLSGKNVDFTLFSDMSAEQIATEVIRIADRNPTPEQSIERQEFRETLMSAIDKLPENQQLTLTLFYLNGMSYHEVANFLEVSQATVKSRLQRARRNLREELGAMVEQTFQKNRLTPDFAHGIFSQIPDFEIIKAHGNFAEGIFELQKTSFSLTHGRSYGATGILTEPFPMYMVFYFVLRPQEILRLPIQIGARWSGMVCRHGIEGETIVESLSETVALKDKTYTDCLKLKTVISGKSAEAKYHTAKGRRADLFICGERTMWFKKGVGLVKLHYAHADDAQTEIELLDVSLAEEKKNEYLPLSLGNQWTYRWTNSYRKYWVQETCAVAEVDGDFYAIKCAARYIETRSEHSFAKDKENFQ